MSFGMGNSGEEDTFLAEINIVPLVDIMLVLLIIFMVTAPLSISGVSVDLPKTAKHKMKVSNKRLVLSLDQEGGYFIEKVTVPGEQLAAKLKGIFSLRKDRTLYIRADRRVSYGKVMQAMSAAKLAGADRISMLSEEKTTIANGRR